MNARCYGALALALATSAACSEPDTTEHARPAEMSPFSVKNAKSLNLAAELSFRHLYEDREDLLEGVDEIWADRVDIDSIGMAHTRIVQTVNGIPVIGGEAIVHIAANGTIARVTDGLIRHLSVDTKPVYGQQASIDIAVQDFGQGDRLTHLPEAELVAMRHEGADHLAWRIQLRRLDGTAASSMPLYFIDAHTGDVLLRYENMHTYGSNAQDDTTADARGQQANKKAKKLVDDDKSTLDMANGTSYGAANPAEHSDDIALQAHENAGQTLAYFADEHDRDSFDGRGALVQSYVHYGSNYVNAFWDGKRLTYGDGDGNVSRALTVLDVVAHEFTHAVTSHEANLMYYGESGALNEATSDIMAAAVEAHADGGTDASTWKIGEDCWLAGEALRFMNDPAADGTSREHYSTRYTGKSDNGGVHINSGIANLFFYLLVEGGQHPNPNHRVATVTGIGMDPAAQIWYRALTRYMTSNTDFAGARTATVNAATDLFGEDSTQRCEVENAWAEVGVGGACKAVDDDGDKQPKQPEEQPVPPQESDSVLQNAVPRRVSGKPNEMVLFTVEVPQGARDLRISTSGGSGDADLYVRIGSAPTASHYDCRPYRWGNDEACVDDAAQAGTYHIGVLGYSGFRDVVLEARYRAPR